MLTRRLALTLVAAFLALPVQAQTPVPAPNAAQPGPDDRAKQWLTVLDDGKYDDAFSQMEAKGHGRAMTAASLRTVRDPLGAMASRSLKDVKLVKTLPGRPSGQYAVVRYDSGFAQKGAALETITLASTPRGWTVIDYGID